MTPQIITYRILKEGNLLAILLLFTSYVSQAQHEADVWYFGNKAGIDFRSGAPISLSDSKMETREGCATVSTQDGKFLFYSNGENVWNSKHEVMLNGTGLMGGYSSTQSSVVVPFPGNDSLYYIFTTAQEKSPNGFRYSIVNMNRDNGYGEVVTKNVLLLSNVYEKISSVKQSNCSNYWIVTKKWDSDEYYAYLISPAGIASPVISKTGNYTGGLSDYSRGQLKFSPDGTRAACAYNVIYDYVELMDFDNTTGFLSNPLILLPDGPPSERFSLGAYGLEFSPGGHLLYVSLTHGYSSPQATLYQYNVSHTDPLQIVASKTLINNTEYNYCMQVGPDKKIYIASNNKWLNVINYPDVEGTGCGFSKAAISLSGSSETGLPSFIQSVFEDPIITIGNCEVQNMSFSIQNNKHVTRVEWDFGDPSTGIDNFSGSLTPSHQFSKQGVYNVRALIYRSSGCRADTIYKEVSAGRFRIDLGNDTTLCVGDMLSLGSNIPNTYNLWSTGSVANEIIITQSGKYWVKSSLGNTCVTTDTLEVNFKTGPQFTLGKDTSICINQRITLGAKANIANGIYSWNTGDTSSDINVSDAGNYILKIEDASGCETSDTLELFVRPLPFFSLGNDTILCQTLFPVQANAAYADSYSWSTGSATETININSSGLYWAEANHSGCIFRDSIKVLFKPFPSVDLGADTAICKGTTLTLDAANPGSTYLWNNNSNGQKLLVTNRGKYHVTVTTNGCSVQDSIVVRHDFIPYVTLGHDLVICPGQELSITPYTINSQSAYYVWQDGSSTISYKVSQPGSYSLRLTNLCGTISDTVIIKKGVCKLSVPNAFTPNNDRVNDMFRARFGEHVTMFTLTIYNRWGQRIFESTDINKGWDGTHSGILQPAGAYVWTIRFKASDSNEVQLMKGTVTLVL